MADREAPAERAPADRGGLDEAAADFGCFAAVAEPVEGFADLAEFDPLSG
ncbi:hypothetical protein ABZ579_07730 [Streptomyces thermolilacinus]